MACQYKELNGINASDLLSNFLEELESYSRGGRKKYSIKDIVWKDEFTVVVYYEEN